VWKRDGNGMSQPTQEIRRSAPSPGTNSHTRLARHGRRSA
jgi:hypothetical protein